MKRIVIILFLLITTNALLSTVTAFAQLQPGSPAAVKPPDPPPLPEATPFAVAERGAHHRVWERMTYEQSPSGRLVPKPRRYAELATGLHYWEEGQWKESQELIEGYPGGAVARHGQHKVIFANNLNTAGAIDMEMPDGRRLQSHVLGLAYFDSASGKSVLIAKVKDCQGKILSPNQVLYEDAFTDVRADVRYTYTRAGFEQDVILRERPPLPEAYGLDSRATRLQVWTEFVNAPQPMVTARAVASGAGDVLADQKLDFGAMEIGAGRAFSLGNETESDPSGAVPALGGASIPASRSLSPATRRSSRSVPVGKQWVGLEGRQFLVEEVAVAAVAEQLDALPAAKSAAKVGAGSARDMVSAKRFLPGPKVAGPNSGQMQVARLTPPGQGFVLDYVTLNTTLTNYTFKGDTTYFINGTVTLKGTNILEGGAVIKYARYTNSSSGKIYLSTGTLLCRTAPYRPVVFTAKDDNSVGETISGSTGNPTGRYGYRALELAFSGVVRHVRAAYLNTAFCINGNDGLTNEFSDIQVVKSGAAFTQNSSSARLRIENALFCDVENVFDWIDGLEVTGSHLTAHRCKYFAFADATWASICLTNSLLIAVTNWMTFGVSFLTNATVYLMDDTGVFQTVGGGAHYLATNSPYRNAGTTNINPTLLASLQTKTTYPPVAYTNVTFNSAMTFSPQAQRDTDAPDLGYHYEPLDYVFGGCHANSNLTFSAGTAVGWFRASSGWYHAGHGIHLADRQVATFDGTASAPCHWVRLNTVQEQDRTGGYGPGGISGWADEPEDAPEVLARFTRCATLANDGGNHFRDDWGHLTIRANHCEFWSGNLGGYVMQLNLTNCLFDRNYIGLECECSPSLAMRNCTMRGRLLYINHWDQSQWPVWIENCAFDGTTIQMNEYSGGDTNITWCDYNAFLAGSNRLAVLGPHDVVVTNSFNWQTGPLGNFYLPTNSPLIDAGSCYAFQAGLQHFTTHTNQARELGSLVDIGYHYVALDGSGQPPDSDSDGIPDYSDPDSDGDDLPDAWELQYFGNLNQTGSRDYDQDGLTNIEEFYFGYDPTTAHTGGTAASDADKDFDGDLLSNIAELRRYGSDPANAHTFSASKSDAEYIVTAKAWDFDSPVYLLGPYFPGGNRIQFFIIGASADAAYDLYIRPDVNPGTKWKRYYSGSPGQTEIICPMPPGFMNFFCVGLASDYDGDGLTDGYEALVSKTGLNTPLTDTDLLPDGWEVEYGLDPSSAAGDNGDNGNPDGDFRPLPNQTEPLSNLLEWNNGVNGTDPKRHNLNQQQRPVITISVLDATASEGTTDTAKFRLSRSIETGSDLTVYYVLGGTATVGSDYTLDPAPSGVYPEYSVTIFGGQTSRDIEISATGDALTEGPETVIIGLSPDPTDQYVVDSHPHRAMASIRDRVCHAYEVNADFQSGLLVGLVADQDRLKLKSSSSPQFPYVNVACSSRGTVVRIDVNTGDVVGEYRTSPDDIYGDPSRTTVDQYGNVWVANRQDSFSGMGSVTRIGLLIPGPETTRWTRRPDGSYEEDDDGQYFKGPFSYNTCFDRDGDGYIRTSTGLGDILPWSNQRGGVTGVDSAGGVSTAEDEAILGYVRVQGTGTRTIAVDKFNDIWVGGTGTCEHQKVDGLIAHVLSETVFSPGCGGYGGLIDSNGVLWSARGLNGLLRFVPTASSWVCLGSNRGNYGLGIDPQTGKIWHTDYDSGNVVYTWNPDGTPAGGPYSTGGSRPRGVVVDSNGNVWIANSGGNTVGHLRTDGTFIGTVGLTWNSINGTEPTGVAVDSNGKIWVTCLNSDNIMRIDPNAGPTINGYKLGAVDLVVDLGSGAHPYNYSDMTGFNNQIVNPGGCPLKGYWTIVEDGGSLDLRWSISWNPTTPSGTDVKVYARASDDRLALSNQQFVPADHGVELAGVRGRHLEVRVGIIRDTCGKNPFLENLTVCKFSKTLTLLEPLADQEVHEGQDATFHVAVSGTEPLTYQWFFQGNPVGSDSPDLVLTAVDCLDSGQYSVHVTDASGDEIYAGPATLTVIPREITIPSVGIASVYPAEITVSDAPESIRSVMVVLNGLSHERPDDLDILLVSPGGHKIMLMSDAGGSYPVENLTIRFGCDADNGLPDEGPLSSGTFDPANYGLPVEMSFPPAPAGKQDPPVGPYSSSSTSLCFDDGMNPNGTWRLYVVDDQEECSGDVLYSWCLFLYP